MLTAGEERGREHGTRLWLVGMNPQVFAMMRKSKLGEAVGPDGMHLNIEIAVAKYLGSSRESSAD